MLNKEKLLEIKKSNYIKESIYEWTKKKKQNYIKKNL